MGRYSRAHLQDPYRTKIFERSIRVAGEVFVPFGRGCMSPLDLCVMQAAAGELSDAYEKDAHHVYLYCSEPAMFNRIVERGRSAERHLRSGLPFITSRSSQFTRKNNLLAASIGWPR